MRDRRTAIFWAVAWWFARRWMRRRAALAVANVSGGVASRRRPIAAVAGALGLVAVLATAFVVWRRLSGGSAEEALPPPQPTPATPPTPIHEPTPPPAAA